MKTPSVVRVLSSRVNTIPASCSLISTVLNTGILSTNLSNNLIVSFCVYVSISASSATSISTSGISASLSASSVRLVSLALNVTSNSSNEGIAEYVS